LDAGRLRGADDEVGVASKNIGMRTAPALKAGAEETQSVQPGTPTRLSS
jgi:hypothetical protein